MAKIRKRSDRPRPAETRKPAPAESYVETIFMDPRAGRERRNRPAATPSDDARRYKRRPGDRRRSLSAKLDWWLQRNYVDSHHFIIKPAAHSRNRKRQDDDA
jgi:hypothetical protein